MPPIPLERRRTPRTLVRAPAELRFGDSLELPPRVPVRLLDISDEGVALSCAELLEAGRRGGLHALLAGGWLDSPIVITRLLDAGDRAPDRFVYGASFVREQATGEPQLEGPEASEETRPSSVMERLWRALALRHGGARRIVRADGVDASRRMLRLMVQHATRLRHDWRTGRWLVETRFRDQRWELLVRRGAGGELQVLDAYRPF